MRRFPFPSIQVEYVIRHTIFAVLDSRGVKSSGSLQRWNNRNEKHRQKVDENVRGRRKGRGKGRRQGKGRGGQTVRKVHRTIEIRFYGEPKSSNNEVEDVAHENEEVGPTAYTRKVYGGDWKWTVYIRSGAGRQNSRNTKVIRLSCSQLAPHTPLTGLNTWASLVYTLFRRLYGDSRPPVNLRNGDSRTYVVVDYTFVSVWILWLLSVWICLLSASGSVLLSCLTRVFNKIFILQCQENDESIIKCV